MSGNYYNQNGYGENYSQYPPPNQYGQEGYGQPQYGQGQYEQNQYSQGQYGEQHGQHGSPPYQNDHSYSQQPAGDYGVFQQGQRSHSPYDGQQQSYPPQPEYGNEYAPPAGPPPGYEGGPPGAEGERGFLGALGGAAVGGYGGHKMGHGVLGAVGGAVAGSMMQDHFKHQKEEEKLRRQQLEQQQRIQQQQMHHPPPAGAPPVHARPHGHFRGNFSASSEEISLDRDCDLIARCGDRNHHKRLTSIDLNDCLTNEWGHFRWLRGGNFMASARHVRLIEGGTVLEAELNDGSGAWRHDRVYLDERISNEDGDLVFLD